MESSDEWNYAIKSFYKKNFNGKRKNQRGAKSKMKEQKGRDLNFQICQRAKSVEVCTKKREQTKEND